MEKKDIVITTKKSRRVYQDKMGKSILTIFENINENDDKYYKIGLILDGRFKLSFLKSQLNSIKREVNNCLKMLQKVEK